MRCSPSLAVKQIRNAGSQRQRRSGGTWGWDPSEREGGRRRKGTKRKKKQALDNSVVKHKPTINRLDPMALQRRRLLEVPSPLPPDVLEES